MQQIIKKQVWAKQYKAMLEHPETLGVTWFVLDVMSVHRDWEAIKTLGDCFEDFKQLQFRFNESFKYREFKTHELIREVEAFWDRLCGEMILARHPVPKFISPLGVYELARVRDALLVCGRAIFNMVYEEMNDDAAE